ncbi:MAG: BLUF domain-containing protein [Phenylobacterium sp.]|uniref:BLUF domain-containing protein n=1 Tax=Phenylobacterium sp. TaxID=1871053 RepID=UPI001A61CB79|nr:BLUF domain-containing protein [Phenylobacterium sp.]MBL8772011.1 BLUF domain-containing protein [Phenylobacterium sp.]
MELARLARISVETIKRLERIRGPVDANARTLKAIVEAFEGLGIGMGSGGGVEGVWFLARRPVAPPPPPSGAHRLLVHGALAPGLERGRGYRVLTAMLEDEGLSGMLILRQGRFLQALEGAVRDVRRAYAALAESPLVRELETLDDRPVAKRLFSGRRAWEASDAMSLAELGLDEALVHAFHPGRLSVAAALGLLVQASERRRARPVAEAAS